MAANHRNKATAFEPTAAFPIVFRSRRLIGGSIAECPATCIFVLKTGPTVVGPPPAKLQPFSLWPIMAEENDNGLFEI